MHPTFRRLSLRALLAAGLMGLGLAAAALPQGKSILPGDLSLWQLVGKRTAEIKQSVVPVEGQPFKQAIRLECAGQYDFIWDAQIHLPVPEPVKAGDVMLLSFYARCDKSLQESGDGRSQAVYELARDPWTKSVENDLRIPRAWQRFDVRFTAAEDYKANEAHVVLRLGYDVQTLEFGGIQLRNFAKAAQLKDLPVTKITYAGMEPDAPWRAAALKRIETLRKAPLAVRVVDAQGRAVPGASVSAKMTCHEFAWGTAVAGERLMGWGDSPEGQKYKDNLVTYFNTITEENAFKWKALAGDWGPAFTADTAMITANFAADNGMRFRGHVLAWPSARNMPSRLLSEAGGDWGKIEQAQLEHIRSTMELTRGKAWQWDVLNEPFDNHEMQDKLGDGIMADWFKEARKADPAAGLCINDYSILAGGGGDSAHRKHYEKTIRDLLAAGAPVQAIGMQGHFGMGLTSPEEMTKILDRYAALGLPIIITEYDFITEDEALAAGFLRDLMITLYSHPAVVGMVTWGFWDGAHWKKNAPFFHEDWTPKPALKEYDDLVFNRWWTKAQGATGKDGVYRLSGFRGDYAIEASTPAGLKGEAKAKLGKDGATVEVVVQ